MARRRRRGHRPGRDGSARAAGACLHPRHPRRRAAAQRPAHRRHPDGPGRPAGRARRRRSGSSAGSQPSREAPHPGQWQPGGRTPAERKHMAQRCTADSRAVRRRPRRRRRGSSRPTGSGGSGAESESGVHGAPAASTARGPVGEAVAAGADTRTDSASERQERARRHDGVDRRTVRTAGQRQGRASSVIAIAGPARAPAGQQRPGRQRARALTSVARAASRTGRQYRDDDSAAAAAGPLPRPAARNGRPAGSGYGDAEPVIREDDVLVPVAGILDVLGQATPSSAPPATWPAPTTSTSRCP